jgi:hypothetical protein
MLEFGMEYGVYVAVAFLFSLCFPQRHFFIVLLFVLRRLSIPSLANALTTLKRSPKHKNCPKTGTDAPKLTRLPQNLHAMPPKTWAMP